MPLVRELDSNSNHSRPFVSYLLPTCLSSSFRYFLLILHLYSITGTLLPSSYPLLCKHPKRRLVSEFLVVTTTYHLAMASTTLTHSLSSNLQKNSPFESSSFHGTPVAPPSLRLQPMKAASQNNSLSVSMSAGLNPQYDLQSFRFDPIKESIVSREMTRRYMTDMITYADTDVVVVGAGSAGLSCAYELSKNPSVQVAIIEQSVSPGGGAWLGGQLFSAMVILDPRLRILSLSLSVSVYV